MRAKAKGQRASDGVAGEDGGRVAAVGAPAEVLVPELVEEVYGTLPIVLPHPDNGVPQILLRGRLDG